MAGGLDWAMVKMGWRTPEEGEELLEGSLAKAADIREYPFSDIQRNEPESTVTSVRSHMVAEAPKRRIETDESAERQRIATFHPRSYADALAVGEAFRDNIPVIMNLTEMDDAEARRVIDFAGGLTFALRGRIERVTTRVFLLSPEELEVTHDGAGSGQSLYR